MYFSQRSPTTYATVSMRRVLSFVVLYGTLPQEKQRMGTIIFACERVFIWRERCATVSVSMQEVAR
jgi:hypothetical protein